MKFNQLVTAIQRTHDAFLQQAVHAVNTAVTVRNWLIGCYIVEYEQKGDDRAKYGQRLVEKLSRMLQKHRIRGMAAAELSRYRTFYQMYPQILGTLSQQFNDKTSRLPAISILGTLSQEFKNEPIVPAEKLIGRLSFSHFVELIKIDEPLRRAFYEIECIKGNWSVRELRRQIDSLYFERSRLSKQPKKLLTSLKKNLSPLTPDDIIKNIYTFEFLGLPAKDAVEESDLESALLDHLKEFILELGHGFCFEARQKRLLIGGEYFFVDLVFYHRVLKRHVLVELKVDAFKHEYIGQLGTYLNYFNHEIKERSDNPPIGILLVTDRNKTYVEYALAGSRNKLFVSKYRLQLPSEKELRGFLNKELKKL